MADSDSISDSTPNKRRKITHEPSGAIIVDGSDSDDGGITVSRRGAMAGTQPTVPMSYVPNKLQYSSAQFSEDLAALQSSNNAAYVTQSTQPLPQHHETQSTLPLTSPPRSDVRVPDSSPPRPAPPTPIQRSSVSGARRGGLLAGAVAGPRGTQFKRPSLQPRLFHPPSDDEDPPVDDVTEEADTQGASLKQTLFKGGPSKITSTPPTSRISETPRKENAGGPSEFLSLIKQFEHKDTNTGGPSRSSDDMANSYGGYRRPKPLQQNRQTAPSRAQPVSSEDEHDYIKTLDDIEDFKARKKVERMQAIFHTKSVKQLYHALAISKFEVDDAMSFLADQDAEQPDELSSDSPVRVRGQPNRDSEIRSDFSQKIAKPPAKQELKAPQLSISEKYRKPSQVARPVERSPTEPEESITAVRRQPQPQPATKRRLVRKDQLTRRRSSTPPSSPAKPASRSNSRARKQASIVISSDEEEEEEEEEAEEELVEEVPMSSSDRRLLQFLNDCSLSDLIDLCGQPEDLVKTVLEHRPFASLDAVEAIIDQPTTKSGKRGKPRQIGQKILDSAQGMWQGYEAVDELVEQCEQLAAPIRQALKSWGVGDASNGELQLMNLDDAHDSGIGTPASSYNEDGTRPVKKLSRSKALRQPENFEDVTMKDYQVVGLNWLHMLWEKEISCILADDMGLGKTCQVIAFLAQLKLESVRGVHLVIVPGSTLENWIRELHRFCPALRVFPYYGGQKERPAIQLDLQDQIEDIDVIVTTYDMATKQQDNKFLRSLKPVVCVYDEAHALRNPDSDRYYYLMRIPSKFRILLTGTPLQNNLQELIAILAFIMPNIFQGKREELNYIFKHKATTKDADHTALLSSDRIARARTMMTPFILRRKKHQVLDLPAKHSRVEWCEMTASQNEYYQELVAEAQQMFADQASSGKAKAKSNKASSNMLMALRKAAIHPLLSRKRYNDEKIQKMANELSKHDEFGDNGIVKIKTYLTGEHAQGLSGGDYGLHFFCMERPYMHKFALKAKGGVEPWMDCGKVQKFRELVQGYQKNGDRLLVFSQFTTMMNILEAVLESLQIKFMRLDGSTKMDTRQDMLDQFHADESITVFMLSTRAGGAGINLACANRVIIFDSGFNPQDDIQAENRAHRVGQTREVEVVRLVTRGTIEEQIHALGESKLALDERVAGEGATSQDDKEAQKKGEQMVEKMFMDSLKQESHVKEETQEGTDVKEEAQEEAHVKKEAQVKQAPRVKEESVDIKEEFKTGLERAGLKVKSKQAQY